MGAGPLFDTITTTADSPAVELVLPSNTPDLEKVIPIVIEASGAFSIVNASDAVEGLPVPAVTLGNAGFPAGTYEVGPSRGKLFLYAASTVNVKITFARAV